MEEVSAADPTVLVTHRLEFGQNILWLDCVKGVTGSKIWLEICTDDVQSAANYLRVNDVTICDEAEEIDPPMHRIEDPAGNIFLLKKQMN
ncbi:hypothetical protein [Sphingobacterium gobiense]|uniref:hypothetical protein n=1 Tax=Sphingobacterium gobiense TaxID=1382456 RepID=UPI001C61143B|nr:hypothetical protein [Sphingobacterium gobiense]